MPSTVSLSSSSPKPATPPAPPFLSTPPSTPSTPSPSPPPTPTPPTSSSKPTSSPSTLINSASQQPPAALSSNQPTQWANKVTSPSPPRVFNNTSYKTLNLLQSLPLLLLLVPRVLSLKMFLPPPALPSTSSTMEPKTVTTIPSSSKHKSPSSDSPQDNPSNSNSASSTSCLLRLDYSP